MTERKTAEDALRESERRYYTLYNSIDEGFCIIEMIFDGNQKPVDYLFLEVNASFEKQTGLKDATSKRVRQLVPNLEPFWFEVYGNVALTGEAIRFEHHAEDIGGRCFDAYAFKLGGPESRKVAVIFSDITQRKLAERMLRESDQRLHLATEATGAGIWEWNVLTGAIKWDAQMFRIYGIAPTPDGIVEYDQWAKCLLGEDLPQQEAILQNTVRQQGHSKREFRIIRPDDKACRHIQSAEATRSNDQGQVEWVVGTNLDITESKLAEVELRESEMRYRRLFEAANDGVLLLDPATCKITDANPFMTRLLGYPREQLIGKELYEIGLLKDETASRTMFEKLKVDHNVRYENLPLESQGGQNQEVEVVANLYDEDGLYVIQCNIRDITERKLAGDALRENEERYRALVEATATAVWRTTPDGSVVFASDNWNKITGQTEEQKRGWGWLDAIHPNDREPTIKRWKYSLETQTVHENEFRVRTAAGEYRWFSIRAVPIFNANGEVREWVGANTDIHDRKQGVDELENSRQRLRLAMDAAGLTYVEVDLISGGIRTAENFSAVMGFTTPAEEQVEGAFGADLLLDHVDPADRDRVAKALEQFVTGKSSGTVEYRVRGDDNITRCIETNWSVEREVNGQRQKSFATNLDITERKKTEEVVLRNNNDLKLAKAAAEKANLAKSDFLSNMSHELRTPLGAILGFAQLIETSEPPPTATQKRSVDQILQAGWYLLDLINEILDLSVVESGRLTISMEPVSLANVMLECRDMIDPQAMTRGISVTFSSLDVPHWVQADPTRLKQVLINLLSNAIKYNKVSGTVDVDCKLVAPQTVRVFVRDTGFGLNEEQLSQLFQPFNRLGRQTGKEEGAGIGLVVSKRLVELMGGKIGVESIIGRGCVFWFDLNLAPAPEAVGKKMKMKLATDSLVSAGPHKHSMLYVEDNPANLQLVEGILERRSDIRLVSAKNANRGIEIARNARPDII
ncbi:MAG: PAS domain S-box protein, partial [Burkholderiales bacterium]